MTQVKKAWHMSKTKWAGVLTGLGIAIPGLVEWLNGGVFPLKEVYAGATAILFVFGIRDLPGLNRK